LGSVRCIKGDDGKILVEEPKIRERWRSYFSKLFNGERNVYSQSMRRRGQEGHNYRLCCSISKEKVSDALRKMKSGKAVGSDYMPMEIWKCLGIERIEWLAKLFNVILRTTKMSQERRTSTIILLYKNKGDIQDCNNYRDIKLLSHTMIGGRLRKDVLISENQFHFIPGRSTTEAIDLI